MLWILFSMKLKITRSVSHISHRLIEIGSKGTVENEVRLFWFTTGLFDSLTKTL